MIEEIQCIQYRSAKLYLSQDLFAHMQNDSLYFVGDMSKEVMLLRAKEKQIVQTKISYVM